MAEAKDYPIRVKFEMADPEGTAAFRAAAGHAARVGEMWVSLSKEMFDMADAFDRLTIEGDGK